MNSQPPALDPELLEILACPVCHSRLAAEPDPTQARTLRCTSDTCGLVYPVRDGIPVLLVDEAEPGAASGGAT